MANLENLKNGKPFDKNDPRINRKGRPKGSRNRSTIVRQWLEVKETIKNPITQELEELEQVDIITLGLIKKARKGDVQAYRELMDSGFGKIAQEVHNFNYDDLSEEELDKELKELTDKLDDNPD
jgi:hypothetical protein